MEAAVQKKSRMQYWDVAKGIVILLVIIGHLPETPEVVKNVIYSFHMPFFFLANAFFIKQYDVKVHLFKNAKSLLVPYVTVCVIEAVCYVLRGNTDIYWSYDIVKLSGEVISGEEMTPFAILMDKLSDMFMGLSFTSYKFKEFESVWIVWFLVSLFAAKMIYVVLQRGIEIACEKCFMKRDMGLGAGRLEKIPQYILKWTSLLTMIVFALLGMWIGQRYAFLPWSLDVSLAVLPFFWLGEHLRRSRILESRNAKWLYGICFVLWVALFAMDMYIELALRIYRGYLLSLVTAAAGSIVVIGIAQFLVKKLEWLSEIFAWCGRYSVVILAIHCLEHRFFDWNEFVYERLPIEFHWSVLFVMHAVAIVGSAWIVVKYKSGIKVWLTTFATNKNRY